MRNRNIAKAVAAVALFGVLLSGCKTQNPPLVPNQTVANVQDNNVQSENLKPTIPEYSDKEKLVHNLNLPEEFTDCTDRVTDEGYNLMYTNGKIDIGVFYVPTQDVYTLQDYAAQDAEHYWVELTQKDGFWTLTYEDMVKGEPKTMVNTYYENEEGFWILQASCLSQDYPQYESQIWQYITGATFAG